MPEPFFTIGVTTYDRHDLLLRQTLESVFKQTFEGFEVIVGNDNPAKVLSAEDIGVSDPRLRILNHPQNLGEVRNLNALLALASGRYFTWLADDDLLPPDHLQAAHDRLVTDDFPDALFPAYELFYGTSAPRFPPVRPETPRRYTGRQFLQDYFAGRLRIISVYGIFERERLRTIVGGIEEVCEAGVALYAEYLFLVKCGRFGRILYAKTPPVFSRAHEGSWSGTNIELDQYVKAGGALIRRCGAVMAHPALSADREANLLALSRMHLMLFSWKAAALEIAAGHLSASGVRRAVKNFSNESSAIREVLDEIGCESRRSARMLVAAGLRGRAAILGMIVVNRFRRMWRAVVSAS